MAYQLNDINYRTVADPRGMIEEADANYAGLVKQAAEKIAENKKNSPIVLLSGPSGSGKTTTAMKIAEALEEKGIGSHYVAMDDYFNTVDPATTSRTPEGDYDLESPLCLDMELLNEHFTLLSQGKRIYVPKYEFSRRMRIQEPSKSIKLKKDEIVIFEGIHALNDMITDRHPEAFKLYISAQSDVVFGGRTVFKRTWFRLVRRTVRDYNFQAFPAGAGGHRALRRAALRAARAAAVRPYRRGPGRGRFADPRIHRRRHVRDLKTYPNRIISLEKTPNIRYTQLVRTKLSIFYGVRI